MSHNPGLGGRSLKVLHVDDDPMNLRVVQEILAAFGHQTVAACGGAEALERLAVEPVDIVLLDIHMPGMTGIEVIRRLRESHGPQASVPVIALTADVYSRRPAEYIALGFNDFVAKPILVSALMASIRKLTGEPSLTRLSRAAV